MNTEMLINIGLTKPQAKAYIYLVKEGSLTPPQMAAKIQESRSNTYKILDRLVDMGLARKTDTDKKLTYHAENPVALENAAKKARDEILSHEKQIRGAIPTLLNYFYTHSEQPGIRFFQGRDGIQEIYLDQIRTGQSIYLVTSPASIHLLGFEFMHKLRNMARKQGIKRYALTADAAGAPKNWRETDKTMLLDRTWIPRESYTAPVEWSVYGDKVAIISFGEEAIGTILYSPQIAESYRQLFHILKKGLRAQPNYHNLPLHADIKASVPKK